MFLELSEYLISKIFNLMRNYQFMAWCKSLENKTRVKVLSLLNENLYGTQEKSNNRHMRLVIPSFLLQSSHIFEASGCRRLSYHA